MNKKIQTMKMMFTVTTWTTAGTPRNERHRKANSAQIWCGLPKERGALFGSVMEMSYGAGKLLAGPLVDSCSPALVLTVSLAACALCNLALKDVRSAQSQLALRKSQLQVAVLNSRQQVLKGKRAAKTGKFGSTEQRNTDPATRKMATNPEDTE